MEQRIWIGKVGKLNLNLLPKVAENSFCPISRKAYGKCTGVGGRDKVREIATSTIRTVGASRGQEKSCP